MTWFGTPLGLWLSYRDPLGMKRVFKMGLDHSRLMQVFSHLLKMFWKMPQEKFPFQSLILMGGPVALA